MDTLVDSYNENGEFNKFRTKIWNTKKYQYELDTSPDVYYRKCPFYGCSSGTSALDITGGKRKKTRKKRRTRKL